MALLVKPNGEKLEVQAKAKDGKFTLQEMYDLIGCEMVELVHLQPSKCGGYSEMWVDEEGKLNGSAYNATATQMAAHKLPGDRVVGNALFMLAKKQKVPQAHVWAPLMVCPADGLIRVAKQYEVCTHCGIIQVMTIDTKPVTYVVLGKETKKDPGCHPKTSR